MSEKLKNKEYGNVTIGKKKHNSKRRRPSKKEINFELRGDSNTDKVDEIVEFLCKNICKGESETPMNINSLKKITKESLNPTPTTVTHDKISKFDYASNFPSTSTFSKKFQNLQVQDSKKSLNVDKILKFEELKDVNLQSESALVSFKEDNHNKILCRNHFKHIMPNNVLKKYFSLSSFQNCHATQSVSNSTSFIEVNQSFHLSSIDGVENIQNYKCLEEYFNIKPLTKPNDNLLKINNSSKSGVNGSKKHLKKYSEHVKKKDNELAEFTSKKKLLDECLQGISNCEISQNKQLQGKKVCESLEESESSLKNLSLKDTKFPEYLTALELDSLFNVGILLTGIIRINQKNFKEAYITAPDKGIDILIEGLRDRNRALDGDEVYYVLKPKEYYRVIHNSNIQKTAVVVGIKKQNHSRGAIGILNVIKNKNANFAMFSPRDSRLPRIRIKKKNWPIGFLENSDNFKHMLYFVRILKWNDLRYADGEIVKEVGLVGDLEAETNALLLKYELDVTPYSENLKKFLPLETFKISETDIINREDFRKECVFTIDPENAVDLDDAVSCKKMSNGNFEVGVHISDVSYFLKEGTPLDVAVGERANTVYLVQKAYHMLPYELCRLCSLTAGEDKLCFSVIWEINSDGEILNHRFTRTVINSCTQLSYGQVQSVISFEKDTVFPKIYGDHKAQEIIEIILLLHKMAVNFRCKRFQNGALKIDQKKIHFLLDENKLPIGYREEVHDHSHQLIEEFMLLANMTVAEHLSQNFPNVALLRCHPPPLQYVLERLQKFLEKHEIILDISSSGSLYASLLKYQGDDIESVARMLAVNHALTKPMARAKYYCSIFYPDDEARHHYALNVPLYTHFTSPIRRYADIIVHRLLAASVCNCDPPKWTSEYVESIAVNCNKKKYAAKMAAETSTELFLSIYIGLLGPTVHEAVVCDIKDKSFDCIVLSTGTHQRLYFEHIKGELIQEKEDGISRLIIKWPEEENYNFKTIQIIKMFSIVKIQLKKTQIGKIESSLIKYRYNE